MFSVSSWKESRSLRRRILTLARYGDFNREIGRADSGTYGNIGLCFLHEQELYLRRLVIWAGCPVVGFVALLLLHLRVVSLDDTAFFLMLGVGFFCVLVGFVLAGSELAALSKRNDAFMAKMLPLFKLVDQWYPVGPDMFHCLDAPSRGELSQKANEALVAIAEKKLQADDEGKRTRAAELNLELTRLHTGLIGVGVPNIKNEAGAYYQDAINRRVRAD
jgi:hypothetical protein